jgi:hypothetical protein
MNHALSAKKQKVKDRCRSTKSQIEHDHIWAYRNSLHADGRVCAVSNYRVGLVQ